MPSAAATAAKPASFTASLDPANPVGFLEKVFDFIAEESDFLVKENVDKEVAAIVRVVKGKSKEKAEEEAQKAENKTEVEKQAMEVHKKEDVKDEETSSGPRVPNKGNGLDLENYSWTQTLEEVTVSVPVPSGTSSRFVVFDIKKNRLKVRLEGQPPVIDGELFQAVKPEECYFDELVEENETDDNLSISIIVTKRNQMEYWESLVKGDPAIVPQKLVNMMGLPSYDELDKAMSKYP
ncbi:HSP20-like chaperones superfamily protein isoform 2 [Hibiscus syriacus]|uniref:HSP20-like chaperones superfamily protein isoform 2 n=1 Tax=Hibiscus syriacus TaxID=106335 RepID=A0A6A3BJK8_HIBSY|nr:HSP20-like chaperones superfamily protein isoform 2 [Hibiscus syriacus]